MTHLISFLQDHKKKWGKEIWIVNCSKYCAKYLVIDKGAHSSYHYHKKKEETFLIVKGCVLLYVDNKSILMERLSHTVTIKPGTPHAFQALCNSTILEVSTHHSEDDVVRLSESEGGVQW